MTVTETGGVQTAEISAFLTQLASSKPQDGNAEQVYRWALQLDENNAHALNQLGRMRLKRGEYQEALGFFAAAQSTDDNPAFCVNAAAALLRLGESDHAQILCDAALELDANFLPAYIQKTAIFEECGSYDNALETIAQGLAVNPECHELLFSRGLIELRRGDFENGWKDFENRQSRLELLPKLDEHPEWQGERLAGKTLLIIGEQGIGDQIMFARYIHFQFGCQVVTFTRPELARLFAENSYGVLVVSSDRELASVKPDYWIGVGSLRPHFEVEGPAPATPYLEPNPADKARFAALMPKTGRLRVGLCWAGNPEHRRDAQRSIRFEDLETILNIPGVDFYSLQAGTAAAQNDGHAKDLIGYCHDFADTAAAIANLDLVISVDTSVLHLAGAMGKPTWALLDSIGDWRWGHFSRDDTQWYSSAKLFRQSHASDWDEPVRRVAGALAVLIGASILEFGTNTHPVMLSLAGKVDPIVTRQTRYGKLSWFRNDTYIGRSLDLYGEYSQAEADLLAAVLKPGDTVIEAGANIGALTVAIAQTVGKGGTVLAFEPQPAYAKLLSENAPSELNAIMSCRMALGAAKGEPLCLKSVETERVHAPGWESTGPEFAVRQTSIDSIQLCERVHLIKIDVDGQELEILKGAEETIMRDRPFLYVENDKPHVYPDLIPWLDAHGYRIYQHFAPLFNPDNFNGYRVNVFGKIVSAMLFCIPKERYGFDELIERFRLERIVVTR